MFTRYLLFILLSCLSFKAQAQQVPPIVVHQVHKNFLIVSGLEYIQDRNHSLNINDVIKSDSFQIWPHGIPNFGATPYAYWIRIKIKNDNDNGKLILKLSSPMIDSINFYEPLDSGIRTVMTGESYTFANRERLSSDFMFFVSLRPMHEKYVYLRVSSSDPILLPISVGTGRSMSDSDKYKDIFWGMYIGLMIAMLLYNCFVYITTRDKSYLFYITYVLSVLIAQITISGYGFQLLWHNIGWLAKSSAYLTPAIVGIAGMEFMRHFLRTKHYVPKADKFFFLLYILYGIAVIAAIAGCYAITFNVIDATASLVSIYMLIIAIIIYKKGYRPAGFFLISWIAFLVGVFIYVFKNFNVLPYSNFTVYTMPIGSAMEVILLSFALADRINILKKEKEQHQAEAIAALKENERIIREQNITLEKKVTERTHELTESYNNLNKALTDLKEAEAQLVDKEKMASLGQLTAGIAHEINNPINFVTSNVKPLNRDVLILLEAIQEIEKMALVESTTAEKQKKINSYKEEIDFDYLKEEINQLLTGIADGASRTAEIVKGLRIFSRLDEDDIKKADINEGLESTLIITNNLLSHIVKIEKNYGNLPLVECYPGKLNQVFLNIISNGIYAVGKKFGDKEGGIISITTYRDDDHVYIKIGDNGIGMDEKTKKRLFEPFFTTKEVGEGTGLGMSIAYNTINKHNGQININSELGKGTDFIIKLPLIQK